MLIPDKYLMAQGFFGLVHLHIDAEVWPAKLRFVVRKLLLAFAVIALLLVGGGLFVTLRQPNYAPVPLPNPNGYDELLFAAQMVSAPASGPNERVTAEELARAVAANAEALKMARNALAKECRVSSQNPFAQVLRTGKNPPSFRHLASAFQLEGNVDESEGREAEAAENYFTIIRLGQEIMRGGIVIDALTGATIEGRGTAALEKLKSKLGAQQCKELAKRIEEADGKRETVDAVVHQEKIWARREFGWRYYMHPVVILQARHRASAITVQQQRTRHVMILFAERAFELEHGAKPKRIEELVPGYLKAVPKDAFTGKDWGYMP